MEACGEDRSVAVELIELFCETTGPEFSRLESAAASRDAPTLRAAAHKCAGSSGTCGMMVLARRLQELETASIGGVPKDLHDRLQAINREKGEIRNLLHKLFQQTFEF